MSNWAILADLSPTLLEPIIEKCQRIDWTDTIYSRFEKPLVAGKMLEYPFILMDTPYSEKDKELIMASRPLFECIKIMYPGYLVVRAEIGTLLPKSALLWHVDKNRTWDWHSLCKKIHVPLITNQGRKQLWQDDECHMRVGCLYHFNHLEIHSAVNDGAENRVHLIFSIMPESSWDDLVEVLKPHADISDRLRYGRDLIVD